MSKCKYSTYGNRCSSEFINNEGFCKEHANLKCWCGQQAVEGCSMELQFVCGAPLCEDHGDRCPAHGGVKPPKKCESCGQDLPD